MDENEKSQLYARINAIEFLLTDLNERWARQAHNRDPRSWAIGRGGQLSRRPIASRDPLVPEAVTEIRAALKKLWQHTVDRLPEAPK
jgi:hypothetical protein